MKRSIVSAAIILMLVLFHEQLYAQEAGISFGTSVFPAVVLEQSYSYIDFVPSSPISRSTLAASKELLFHFSYYLHSNIRLDLSTGYGFSSTKKDWRTVFHGGGNDLVSTYSEELNTQGYPGLIELQFFAPLTGSYSEFIKMEAA